MNLKSPLNIVGGLLERTEDQKSSIDQSLELLLNTQIGTVPLAPDYGFVFSNLRFQNIDESQGTVYDDSPEKDDPLYKLKLSGSSKNLQTFAAELNETIKKYERRLGDTSTVMTYIRQSRTIIVAVRGTIAESGLPYEYRTLIKIWNR